MKKIDHILFQTLKHIRNIVAVRLLLEGVEMYADYLSLEESGFKDEKKWNKITNSLTNKQIHDSWNIVANFIRLAFRKTKGDTVYISERLSAMWSVFCFSNFKDREVREQWLVKGWEVIKEHTQIKVA